jgi:hypothetical protein
MPTIEQLLQSIDSRIRELNGEIALLQDARSALTSNGSAPPPPSPKRRVRPSARRKPASKPAVVVPPGQLERLLSEGDGLTTAALAKQVGGDPDQVLTFLRQLETAGRVRRTGQRRGTRWHPYTDEDRIQERAAELASRSRRRS